MSDYLSSVLDELVPTFADEDGDWGRVVADAAAEATMTTAQPRPVDAATSSAAPGRGHGRWPARWLTRRRLVAIAVTAVLAALLVTPALGIGSRLIDLIQDSPPPRQTREPVWSPDGRRILYVSRGERNTWDLYVINVDGSGQRKMASVASATAAWSPDGRRIVFAGRKGSGPFVINVDGSGQRKLAPRGDDPAWSPDGRKIAFAAGAKLWVVNVDGTGQRRLWTAGRMSSPAWSPDGEKVLFLSDEDNPCDYCFHVYVVNADGSGERRLTHDATPGAPTPSTVQSNYAPAWSPDGRRIAFVRTTGFPQHLGDVWVMNADGRAPRKLTRGVWGAGRYGALAWSPDGRKLAFTSDRDGNAEVYSINANGSALRRLTISPEFDGDGAWSPDGRRIVFVSNRDGDSDVYVMNADGSGQRRLAKGGS